MKIFRFGSAALLFLVMAIGLAGCAGPGARVMAIGGQDVVALDADDVVRVMRRAGFSDQQVIDLGTDVRNALASTGGAQVRVGRKVEALFAVDGQYLHGSSRRRGSFIYDLATHEFRR